MKITDVSVTLFAWDDIPSTQYGRHTTAVGSSDLGLVAIEDLEELLLACPAEAFGEGGSESTFTSALKIEVVTN